MYIPPVGCDYDDANTNIIYADDGNGIARFTKKFKYLGFLLTPELTSTAEVDKRLAAAALAFGQLRKPVFGSKVILYDVKAKIYNALILIAYCYMVANAGHYQQKIDIDCSYFIEDVLD